MPHALQRLEDFLCARDDLPPLVRVALARPLFETLHSFFEGNDRADRLLAPFLLIERCLLATPVLDLSHAFKRRPTECCE